MHLCFVQWGCFRRKYHQPLVYRGMWLTAFSFCRKAVCETQQQTAEPDLPLRPAPPIIQLWSSGNVERWLPDGLVSRKHTHVHTRRQFEGIHPWTLRRWYVLKLLHGPCENTTLSWVQFSVHWPLTLCCCAVALNFQTPGEQMDLNQGRFLANGRCGYILKPAFLCSVKSNFNPENTGGGPGHIPTQLTIRVSPGRDLSVELDWFRCKNSKAIQKNWNRFLLMYKNLKTKKVPRLQ